MLRQLDSRECGQGQAVPWPAGDQSMHAGMMDENAGLSTMPDTTMPSETVGLYAAAWYMPCFCPSGAPCQQLAQTWQPLLGSQHPAQQQQAIYLALLGAAGAAASASEKTAHVQVIHD